MIEREVQLARLPGAAAAALVARRRVLRARPRPRRRREAAGLVGRDLSRAAPRDADHPERRQAQASPRRARADHRRDAGVAWRICSARAAPTSLEPLWRVVLKNEFHDILPGSGIREVYEDAERELDDVDRARRRREQDGALSAIAALCPRGPANGEAVLIVNPSLDERPFALDLPDGSSSRLPRRSRRWACASSRRAALQPPAVCRTRPATSGERASARRARRRRDDRQPRPQGDAAARRSTGAATSSGSIPSDKPRNWDAWDVEEDYEERGEEITALREPRGRRASAPHQRGAPRQPALAPFAHRAGDRLAANGAPARHPHQLDWHDRRVLLRALTPAACARAARDVRMRLRRDRAADPRQHLWDAAMFEGVGASLRRSRRARLWRRAAQRRQVRPQRARQRARPEPACARRSIPTRSPTRASRRFTYALMPHAGDWHEGGVRERGRGPQPAAAVAPRLRPRRGDARHRCASMGLRAAPGGLEAGRGRRRPRPARLRTRRRARPFHARAAERMGSQRPAEPDGRALRAQGRRRPRAIRGQDLAIPTKND